jgi:hypothetical protein
MFLLNLKIPLALPVTLLSLILGATSAHAITLRKYEISKKQLENNTLAPISNSNDLLGDADPNNGNIKANISCTATKTKIDSGFNCEGDYPNDTNQTFDFETVPYVEFSFEPQSGYTSSINSLSFGLKDSGNNDPTKVAIFSNITGFSSGNQLGSQSGITVSVNGTNVSDGILGPTSLNSSTNNVTITLNNQFENLDTETNFRIYGYNASSKNNQKENLVIKPNGNTGTISAEGSTQQAVPFEAEGTMGLIALGGYFW